MNIPIVPSFAISYAKEFRTSLIKAARDFPVAQGSDQGEVYVFGHEAVRLGLTDRRFTGVGLSFFDASGVPEGELRDWYGRIMFTNEGQTHHRLRRLVGKAFTPKALTWLREEAREIATTRLAGLKASGGGNMLAEMRDVPMQLMCSLLGVPKEDVGKFFNWVADLSPVFAFMTPEQVETASAALHNLRAYVDEMVETRSATPRDDLITRLIEAEHEGDRLTRDETVDMVTNLLIAGQDTTLSQIACSLYVLFRYADWSELADLDDTALSSLVDETIRMEVSIAAAPRTTVEAVELEGKPLDPGAIVMLTTYTANRDPAIWDEPDAFRPTRFLDPDAPKMMSFGGGAHFCLGAWLARLTLEEVLRATIEARPQLRVDPESLEWISATGSNPVELPVGFAG